jgi:hypothetical protein
VFVAKMSPCDPLRIPRPTDKPPLFVQARRISLRLELVGWRSGRSNSWKTAAVRFPGIIFLRDLDNAIEAVSMPRGIDTQLKNAVKPQFSKGCSNCRIGPAHLPSKCPSAICGYWARTGDCKFGGACTRASTHTLAAKESKAKVKMAQ